jgi:aldose sugar dehydrogenase
MIARLVSLLAVMCLIAGCHKNDQPSQQPPPSGEQITGNERLGWTQQATDATELADFKYAIYVDGTRSTLSGVSCSTTPASAGFDCTAPLPRMSNGAHALEMASYVDNGGTVLESPRSATLRVIVSAAATTGGAASANSLKGGELLTTADGARLRIEVVARGLEAPTDLAAAPDGRLFVAEQAGRIQVIRGGALQPAPDVALSDAVAGSGRLLAIALDPRFADTHSLYAIYTRPAQDQRPVFTLARFREVHDTLGDRAILLDDIPAASPRSAASVRFGADGKLYVALDEGGRPGSSGDLASFNGKLLRLNPDGTTPDDQAGLTPVFSFEYRSPRGFDWQPGSGSIWIADGVANGTTRVSAVAASGQRPRRASLIAAYALPSVADASAVAFYRGNLIPAFRGDLLIASDEGNHILRIRFDRNDPARVVTTERLLQDQVGNIRALAVAPDGTIYFCTPHELARLVPAE